MEIPIVEKEVRSHQSHYKVSRTSSRLPFPLPSTPLLPSRGLTLSPPFR